LPQSEAPENCEPPWGRFAGEGLTATRRIRRRQSALPAGKVLLPITFMFDGRRAKACRPPLLAGK